MWSLNGGWWARVILLNDSRSCQTLGALTPECVLSPRSPHRSPSQMHTDAYNLAPPCNPMLGIPGDNRTSTLNMKSQDSGGQQLTHRLLADTT